MNKALKRVKKRDTDKGPRSAATPLKVSKGRKRTRSKVQNELGSTAKTVKLDTDLLTKRRIITDEMEPSARTPYKMLRTRLLQRMRTNGWQSIAVTSATQGDGKTVTAINLAISIAGDVNHNVCLVDLDMRHSSVADYLGLDIKCGVSDCLKRKVPIEEAVVKPDIDRLLFLPNLTIESQSSEILSSPEAKDFVGELTSDPQRIMIYDMPPVLAADDMLAFSRNVDAVLFVVAEGVTARTDVMKAFELLEDIEIIGTLLNRSDEETAAYY